MLRSSKIFTIFSPKKSVVFNQRALKRQLSSKDELKGTVAFHQLHLGFLTPSHSWPVKFFNTSPFHLEFFTQLRNFSPELFSSIKLTNMYSSQQHIIKNIQETSQTINDDIVIFPLGLKFSNVQNDLASFFKFLELHFKNNFTSQVALTWIANNKTNLNVTSINSKTQLIICTHNEVDCRCGLKGGEIYESLEKLRDKDWEFSIFKSSHIGGHKYAGNVIVYPHGDWYGYIDKKNLPTLIEHIKNDKIWQEHWRGRIGLSKPEQVSYL